MRVLPFYYDTLGEKGPGLHPLGPILRPFLRHLGGFGQFGRRAHVKCLAHGITKSILNAFISIDINACELLG